MKILLTGATGYIGKRILPVQLEQGHQVICSGRDKSRFPKDGIFAHPNISLFESDFLQVIQYDEILNGVDAAYYLIHSMSSGINDFERLEETSAHNFLKLIEQTAAKQIIFLSGITNESNLFANAEAKEYLA